MTTELYLQPPQVLVAPEPRYAGQRRMFQGIPGIERAPNGRLWATWYGGGITEDHCNYVLLVTSGDDGLTWSPPQLIVDPDGEGPVRAFDPCLWHDPTGRLWLFWAQGYERHTDEHSGVWAIVTDNAGREDPPWSKPHRLCDGIMMNKPLALSSGAWLLPAASWRQAPSARVVSSTDQGETWCELGGATIPDPAHRNADEHMLVERRDGTLWMLVRTSYGIGESTSGDGGRTWSPVTPSQVQHPTSRFFVRRLASGRLLLVKHGPIDARTDRSLLTAFLSEDDGATWSQGLLLDERAGVSYPDAVQGDDRTIYLIYDYDRKGAKEIQMARFAEQDVWAGTFRSPRAAARLLVNKATGRSVPNA